MYIYRDIPFKIISIPQCLYNIDMNLMKKPILTEKMFACSNIQSVLREKKYLFNRTLNSIKKSIYKKVYIIK